MAPRTATTNASDVDPERSRRAAGSAIGDGGNDHERGQGQDGWKSRIEQTTRDALGRDDLVESKSQ